jgi:hypothetical protein
VLLGAAGVFLLIAVVFGVLAYFQVVPQPHAGFTNVSVPVTVTATASPNPNPSVSVPATPAAVTVTQTTVIAVPGAPSGSTIGSLESLAGTLSSVVAAACAVIALRPRGRRSPPAPAAAADAPASTPST